MWAMPSLGPLDERRIVRFNGKPAIALGVVKQATANPLEVVEEVAEATLPSITASLPEGMQVESRSRQIGVHPPSSIKNVYETIGEAIALVVLIIFLFLRSIRATLIPLVTIPVSLIGAFALMYMLRLHHQHADAARARARHRAGRRRRHRHAGEHLPSRRRRHDAGRGGADRQPGNRLRHHRHDH